MLNARLTGDARTAAREEAALLYQDGASVRDIATRTGRPYGTVYALLREAGVRLRPRGARRT